MQQAIPLTERLITRDQAIIEATEARYGYQAVLDGKTINSVTFWRWCQEVGIPRRSFPLTQEQLDKVLTLARHYRNGGSTLEYLRKQAS